MFLYKFVLILVLCVSRLKAAAIKSGTTAQCSRADGASIDRCSRPFWRSMQAVSSPTLSLIQSFSYQVSLFGQVAPLPPLFGGDATDGGEMLAKTLKGLNLFGKDSDSMDGILASLIEQLSKIWQGDTSSWNTSDKKGGTDFDFANMFNFTNLFPDDSWEHDRMNDSESNTIDPDWDKDAGTDFDIGSMLNLTNLLLKAQETQNESQQNESRPDLDFNELFGNDPDMMPNKPDSGKGDSDQELDKFGQELAEMTQDLNKISAELNALNNLQQGDGGNLRDGDGNVGLDKLHGSFRPGPEPEADEPDASKVSGALNDMRSALTRRKRDADDPADSNNAMAIVCRAYESFQDCNRAVGIQERCRDNRKVFALRVVYGYVCGEGKQALETARKTCFRGEMTLTDLMRAGSQRHQAETSESLLSSFSSCLSYVGGILRTNAGHLSTIEEGYRCLCRAVNKQLTGLADGAQIKCGKGGHDFFEGYRVYAMDQITSSYPDLGNCGSLTTADEGQPQDNDPSAALANGMRMLKGMKPMISYFRTFVSSLGRLQGPCQPQTLQVKAIMCLLDYLAAVPMPRSPAPFHVLGQSLCGSKQHFQQCLNTELTGCVKHHGVDIYCDYIMDTCATYDQSDHCPLLKDKIFTGNFASMAELRCGSMMDIVGEMYFESLANQNMIADGRAKQLFDKMVKYVLCSLDVMRPNVEQIRKACGDTAADSLAKYVEDMAKDTPVYAEEMNKIFFTGNPLTSSSWGSIRQALGLN